MAKATTDKGSDAASVAAASNTEEVTLAHHWSYEGQDVAPGDKVTVPLDTARELRAAGYVAGFDPSDPDNAEALTTTTGTENA